MPAGVLRARDVLALYLRGESDRRFRDMQRRSDLEACGRLLAAAYWVECLPEGGQAALLLDFATPTQLPGREFPSKGGQDLLRQWADGECPCPLDMFLTVLIRHEVRATLDDELAAFD